jgi:hypothetical protein
MEIVMKKVHIYGKSYEINLGGSRSDDEWSRDSTSTNWEVYGVAENVPNQYSSFDEIETDIEGKAYALYAIYSSGDSFGHDENAYFNLIWIFKSRKIAEKAKSMIEDHCDWYVKCNHAFYSYNEKVNKKKYESEYSLKVKIDNGKDLTVSASWNGYFDSLTTVDIVECTI